MSTFLRAAFRHFAVILLVLCAHRNIAGAEQTTAPVVNGLSATISTPLILPRANAPFPLQVTITWNGKSLREGCLQVQVYDGNQPLCHWQSDVLALSNGERTSAIVLPPMALNRFNDAVEIRVGWNEGGTHLALATRTLVLRSDRAHALTLALCLPTTTLNPDKGVLQKLSLERYAPERRDDNDKANHDGASPQQQTIPSGLRTVPTRMPVDDLPDAALAWCAYDAVVIAGDNLLKIKARQVQALEQWLRAGGSCCLLPDGPMAPAVNDLLSRLALENSTIFFDRSFIAAATAPAEHLHFHCGLGRLVVAPWITDTNDSEDKTDAAWRHDAAFLWRVRHDHAGILNNSPTWDAADFDKIAENTNDRRGAYKYSSKSPFDAPALQLFPQLIDMLWPERVEVIPFSIIVLIFGVFVLAIGPGDWWLLGKLRARRFTWLLFPTVAISCTWFTVWMSRQYLGGNDQAQHLQVIDLTTDGKTLRRNHFDLLFTGSSKTVAVDERDALWTSLGSQSSDSYNQSRYQRSGRGFNNYDSSGENVTVPLYTGNLPGQYRVEQGVAQWTPVLRRELSFSPISLPWTLPTANITRAEDVATATAVWRDAAGPLSAVFVLRSGKISEKFGDESILQRRGHQHYGFEDHNDTDHHWILPLCSHPTNGWFALSSTMSPAGGATYDDLALCDPSDPNQFLVVFAARRDDTLWVMRCLYRNDTQRPAAKPSH